MERFPTICVAVLPKRGSICVTKHLPATARPTITAHSIGHTFRQSSPTPPKESLSPTAKLFSFNTCLRHRRCNADKQFRSHSPRVKKMHGLACQVAGRHDLLVA